MTVEGLRAALDLNAVTPLMLTRAFAARTGEGSVVNILDTRIDAVDLGHAGYWLAKKLLAAVTELTAAAFAPGIRCERYRRRGRSCLRRAVMRATSPNART